jgi:hypothetical protein
VKVGGFLAPAPGPLVSGALVGRKGVLRQPVESSDGYVDEATGKHKGRPGRLRKNSGFGWRSGSPLRDPLVDSIFSSKLCPARVFDLDQKKIPDLARKSMILEELQGIDFQKSA